MNSRCSHSRLVPLGLSVTFLAVLTLAFAPSLYAQAPAANTSTLFYLTASALNPAAATAPAVAPRAGSVPSGTILPVILRTSFSFENSKAGELLHGEIAQDVPLPDGTTIRRGSRILGHIVSATPASNADPAKISLQFDKLYLQDQSVPLVTNLRAIAGFMEIQEAGVPTESPAEGSPSNWLDTQQIGGDSVYGVDGPVMSADDTSKVIGKSVNGGVLVQASGKPGTRCRGAVNGDEFPQALWVFSGDACGAYGLEHLKIAHSGRTDPKGTIVLTSESPKLKLRSGDGLLLRVN